MTGPIASQLTGVWTLVSYANQQEGHEETYPFGPQPEGFLIYTPDGFVSAQLMKPGRSLFQSKDWNGGTAQEYQESGSGYIAYCGRFEVDEEKETVTHIPSVALVPNLIPQRQVRSVILAGDTLTLRANGGIVTSVLSWRKVSGTSTAEKNKAIVLEGFDTLFNKRDYDVAARFWSPDYIQHSAHIAPGRDGLFNLIKSLPPSLRHEPGVIVAEGDYVILHGRFSGHGLPANWIAADILLLKDGIMVEHWDVIQDEATQEQSKSGRPMFGVRFPTVPKNARGLLEEFTASSFRDPQQAAAMFAEDGALEMPYLESLGFAPRYEGRTEIAKFLTFVRDLYPDLYFHNVKVVMETADQALGEYEFTTISSKTGRMIHQLFLGRLVAENGKIKLLRESLNLVELSLAIYPNGLADFTVPNRS